MAQNFEKFEKFEKTLHELVQTINILVDAVNSLQSTNDNIVNELITLKTNVGAKEKGRRP